MRVMQHLLTGQFINFLRVFLVVSLKIILLSVVVGVLFILYFNKNCSSSFALFKPVPLCNAEKLISL